MSDICETGEESSDCGDAVMSQFEVLDTMQAQSLRIVELFLIQVEKLNPEERKLFCRIIDLLSNPVVTYKRPEGK
jgi:hypothetical protein